MLRGRAWINFSWHSFPTIQSLLSVLGRNYNRYISHCSCFFVFFCLLKLYSVAHSLAHSSRHTTHLSDIKIHYCNNCFFAFLLGYRNLLTFPSILWRDWTRKFSVVLLFRFYSFSCCQEALEISKFNVAARRRLIGRLHPKSVKSLVTQLTH